MKAEYDNEIDALLRRRARAARGGVARDGGEHAEPASAHLDADELSAFAENALPAPARLSAASHLADCDDCRGVVVSLSRAAGDVGKRAAAVDPSEARGAASISGWLAALFSPRALRFVAPALALCLVGAVALVLLRTRRPDSGGTIALRSEDRETARPNAVAGGDADAGANLNANTNADAPAEVDPSERPDLASAPAAQEGPVPHAHVAAPADESPDGSEGRPRDAASSPPAEPVTRAGEAPPPPPRPAAAGAATSASAPALADAAPGAQQPREDAKEKKGDDRGVVSEEVARVENAPTEKRREPPANADNQQTPDGSRNKSSSPVYGGGRAASPRHEPERTNRSLGSARARRSEREQEAARDGDVAGVSAGETRSAAGHRFRKEGGAWVDVNYRPTMSMTGVRRGSEAYRALVADLPELGRIAEQLGGEVIAVVRGRAYRIR